MSNMADLSLAQFEADILTSSRPVLIDFWAEWCGPCKAMAPYLEKLADQYGDRMMFVKVNVETETQLKERFGINSIPQLVMMKGGQETDRFAGFLGTQTPKKLTDFVVANL